MCPYNEEESSNLVEQLLQALRPSGELFELVLVNDGSSDRTAEVLAQLSHEVPELVAVLLRKNYGQTAAMAAGFDVARGEVIISLDGDLQNDPADIPMLLAKLREGYDLVSGWRHQRQDAIQRKLLQDRQPSDRSRHRRSAARLRLFPEGLPAGSSGGSALHASCTLPAGAGLHRRCADHRGEGA